MKITPLETRLEQSKQVFDLGKQFEAKGEMHIASVLYCLSASITMGATDILANYLHPYSLTALETLFDTVLEKRASENAKKN